MLMKILTILLSLLAAMNVSFASIDSTGYAGEIKFIENKNQWPASVTYAAELSSGTAYFKKNAFQFFLYDKEAISEGHNKSHLMNTYENGDEVCIDQPTINGHQYLVNFINSNADVEMSGADESAEYYNYFIGDDRANWAANVKAFQTITYAGLYDGVDMKMYSQGSDLKYDLIIHPGADEQRIALAYTGLDDIYLYDGDLIIETSLGMVREQKPYAYQDIGGRRIPVACNYIFSCGELSFELPEGYNKDHPLVIDPLLIFSTYSGSNADNWGNTATPGEHGKLYSGGITNHFRGSAFLGEFPATPGAFQSSWAGLWDLAIIKYDSSGSQVEYATYLGGSGSEVPHSMIMDNDENLVIMGSTNSTDFPTSTSAYQRTFEGGTSLPTILGETFDNGSDIFIAKLSKDGTMLNGSSYFGGDANDGQNRTGGPLTRNYGDQQRGEVFIDDDNNIYISSVTGSENLFDDPAISSFDRSYNGGESDGVLVKFDTNLEHVIWGGYLGGSQDDAALAVKINSSGQVYASGGTNSADFVTTAGGLHETIQGSEDGFIVLVDKEGTQIISATYIGTSAYDQVYFMDLDVNDDVYVLGQTRGAYPKTAGVYSNTGGGQFIHKLNPDLSESLFSTVFGTTNRNEPNISLTAFLVSECDNIYVAGWGNSQPNFASSNYMSLDTRGLPTTADAFNTTTTGDDFYLMVLDADATELLYATFFGGESALVHVDGGTSRFDKQGIVYHSVCASCSGGSSFPTSEGAWSNVNGSGSGCNNAAFKFDLASLRARIQTNTLAFDNPGVTRICFPSAMVFENISIGGETFVWDFGDDTGEERSDKEPIVHEYENPGSYKVTLTAIDENTCLGVDVDEVIVHLFQSDFSVIDDGDICEGSRFRLEAFGGTSYTWLHSDLSTLSTDQFTLVTPNGTTKYYVKITDALRKCEAFDSVTVNVIPAVLVDFEVSRAYDCMVAPEVIITNLTEHATEYLWSFGDGASSDEFEPKHSYENGVYQLTLSAGHEICSDEKTLEVDARTINSFNVITPRLQDGANDFLVVNSPVSIGLAVYNRWGKLVFESEDYKDDWSAEGQSPGIYYYNLSIEGDQICNGWVQVLK
jgi:hypothetical protein